MCIADGLSLFHIITAIGERLEKNREKAVPRLFHTHSSLAVNKRLLIIIIITVMLSKYEKKNITIQRSMKEIFYIINIE